MQVINCSKCKTEKPKEKYVKMLTSCSDCRDSARKSSDAKPKPSQVGRVKNSFLKLDETDQRKFLNEIRA